MTKRQRLELGLLVLLLAYGGIPSLSPRAGARMEPVFQFRSFQSQVLAPSALFSGELKDMAFGRLEGYERLKSYLGSLAGQEVAMIYVSGAAKDGGPLLSDEYFLVLKIRDSMPERLRATALPKDLANVLHHPGAGYSDGIGFDAPALRDERLTKEWKKFLPILPTLIEQARIRYGHRTDIPTFRVGVRMASLTLAIDLPAYVKGAVRQGQQPVPDGERPLLFRVKRTRDAPNSDFNETMPRRSLVPPEDMERLEQRMAALFEKARRKQFTLTVEAFLEQLGDNDSYSGAEASALYKNVLPALLTAGTAHVSESGRKIIISWLTRMENIIDAVEWVPPFDRTAVRTEFGRLIDWLPGGRTLTAENEKLADLAREFRVGLGTLRNFLYSSRDQSSKNVRRIYRGLLKRGVDPAMLAGSA